MVWPVCPDTYSRQLVFEILEHLPYLICRAAVIVREDDLGQVLDILKSFSMERIYEMRQQVQFFWEKYIGTMKDITLTTLQILNDRVFPYAARKYEEWNDFLRKVAVILLQCFITVLGH